MKREEGSAFGFRHSAFGKADTVSRTPNAQRRTPSTTLTLLVIAAALQIGVVVWRFDQLTIDRDAYLGIAQNLVAGRGFCTPGTTTPTAYRPPLYPLLLAAAMSVLPTAWAVAAINVAAGLITVWLVLRLGERLGLGRGRFIAGLMTAVNPLLLHAIAQPMTEVVFTALTTAWWWAVLRSQTSVRRLNYFMTGIYFGLAALCRPTIWPLAGLMALAWLLRVGIVCRLRSAVAGEAGQAIRMAVFAVAGTLIVVAPWAMRNQSLFGKPVWMTTHGGYTLLLANNPVHDVEVVQRPWGAAWSGESLNRWQRDLHENLRLWNGPNPDEFTQDHWMSQQAKYYIKDHPDRFLASAWHRVRSLWAISPRGEGADLSLTLRGPIAAFFAVEFLLALIGVWFVFRRSEWRAWLPGLLLIVTIQGVHLAYWTDTRMRTPLEPVLALLAARECCALFTRGKDAQG